jgi:hypothetical protein
MRVKFCYDFGFGGVLGAAGLDRQMPVSSRVGLPTWALICRVTGLCRGLGCVRMISHAGQPPPRRAASFAQKKRPQLGEKAEADKFMPVLIG